MPLDDLQRALGVLVATSLSGTDAGSFDGLDLTSEERSWLGRISGSKGLNVTSFVQRSWRELGVYQSAILTASALGRTRAQETIDAYLDTVHCQSLFVFAEAIVFLDFVIKQNSTLPHVDAIARFERALLTSAQSASLTTPAAFRDVAPSPGVRVTPNPASALVEFRATPEALLGALTTGQALPPEGDELFPIIIAPGLEYLWRPATPDESRLFKQCPAEFDTIAAQDPALKAALADLVTIAALLIER
ncbi:MAG TPA: hypothetical protein VFV34_20120 [Blastocatellia bacterium]|nr:hypothetical protein [Blastocatellia bacterium]